MNKRATYVTATAAVMAALFTGSANASLVLLDAQDFQGTGLGAVNTILTIQSPDNSTSESGSVGRAVGDPNDVITGDAKTGASQTQTRAIGQLAVASASDIRVVFNALEPGNPDTSITLSDLVLSIFDPTGALLFSSGAFVPVVFPDTFTGAGNSGFVFGLDALQASAAQSAAFGVGFENNRIGLLATANDATGGIETFFVASGSGGTAIPEPASLGLVGVALGIMGVVSRRRQRGI